MRSSSKLPTSQSSQSSVGCSGHVGSNLLALKDLVPDPTAPLQGSAGVYAPTGQWDSKGTGAHHVMPGQCNPCWCRMTAWKRHYMTLKHLTPPPGLCFSFAIDYLYNFCIRTFTRVLWLDVMIQEPQKFHWWAEWFSGHGLDKESFYWLPNFILASLFRINCFLHVCELAHFCFILKLFKLPLEKEGLVGGPILAQEEIKTIFGSIPDIYEVHTRIKVLSVKHFQTSHLVLWPTFSV